MNSLLRLIPLLILVPSVVVAEQCYHVEELPSSVRVSDFDYRCIGPDGTGVSDHVRPDKAWESCNQASLDQAVSKLQAGDGGPYAPGDVVTSDGHYVKPADYRVTAQVVVIECPGDVTPPPTPVDCQGTWSEWGRVEGSETECVDGQRSYKESRSYTMTTPPQNGGKVCPVSPEIQTLSEACTPPGGGGGTAYVPLEIHPNGRYFTRGGEPFFWIGDTGWQATKNLSMAQITSYLQDVVDRGFNVVQGPIFMSGEVLPPWGSGTNDPIASLNPTTFKSPHIDRIDHFVKTASDLGLVVAIPLVWGPHSNRFFEKDAARAAEYTTKIVSRFKDYPNAIIIVSGEFNKVKWVATTDPWSGDWDKSAANDPLTAQEKAMFNAMGNAARAAAHPESLITIHPDGGKTPGDEFHGESWYDFPLLQSYTSLLTNFQLIKKERARADYRPVVQGENYYETAPGGGISSWMVRQSFYHCYFLGCAGHTYGADGLWNFQPGYESILSREGRVQISTHFRTFVEDTFSPDLVPDQSFLANGSGWPPNNNAVFVLRTPDSSRVMVYTSKGTTPRVKTDAMKPGALTGRWFNPRTGVYNAPFNVNRSVDGVWLNAPSQGDNNDWVLIIDSDEVVASAPSTDNTGTLAVSWKPSTLNEDGTDSNPDQQGFTLYYGTERRKTTHGSKEDYPFSVDVSPGARSVKVPVQPGVYYVAMTASHPSAATSEDPKGEGFFSDEIKVVVE